MNAARLIVDRDGVVDRWQVLGEKLESSTTLAMTCATLPCLMFDCAHGALSL